MRPVFFFIAIALGMGILFSIGPFLFAIWFVGVLVALTFFAVRGIRHFIREGRPGYRPYRMGPRALPFDGEYLPECEPHISAWRESPAAPAGARIIRVE